MRYFVTFLRGRKRKRKSDDYIYWNKIKKKYGKKKKPQNEENNGRREIRLTEEVTRPGVSWEYEQSLRFSKKSRETALQTWINLYVQY